MALLYMELNQDRKDRLYSTHYSEVKAEEICSVAQMMEAVYAVLYLGGRLLLLTIRLRIVFMYTTGAMLVSIALTVNFMFLSASESHKLNIGGFV